MPTFNYRKMESSLVGTIERPVAEILMESAEGDLTSSRSLSKRRKG